MRSQIIEIQKENLQLVTDFLKHAGTSLRHFRYYEKRSFEVLQNHLYTAVLLKNPFNLPIGYGHLDKDKETVWLGIAIKDSETGKGYGRLMMSALIEKAKALSVKEIHLTVDKDNEIARLLYEKLGFKQASQEDLHYKYKLTL